MRAIGTVSRFGYFWRSGRLCGGWWRSCVEQGGTKSHFGKGVRVDTWEGEKGFCREIGRLRGKRL